MLLLSDSRAIQIIIDRRSLMIRWVARRCRKAHWMVRVFRLRLTGMISLDRRWLVVLEEPTIMGIGHVTSMQPRQEVVIPGVNAVQL